MTLVIDAAEENDPVSAFDQTMATAHYWVGISILPLVFVRLIVRVVQGAPEPVADQTLIATAAKATHWLFYALLLAVPTTGLLAVYVSDSFGYIHALGKPVLIVLIAVHALAALFHQVYLKDGTLRRIL